MIRIRVNGTPAPQGSKRHVGNGRMVEVSKAVGPWREAVRSEAQTTLAIRANGERPLSGAVFVSLVFTLARPKGHYGSGRNAGQVKDSAPAYPAGRPDVDKLCRAVLDGLTAGGAFSDDAQVVDLHACKIWAAAGGVPGVDITIREMT